MPWSGDLRQAGLTSATTRVSTATGTCWRLVEVDKAEAGLDGLKAIPCVHPSAQSESLLLKKGRVPKERRVALGQVQIGELGLPHAA